MTAQPPVLTARGEEIDVLTLVQVLGRWSGRWFLIRLIDEVGSGPVVLGGIEIKGGVVIRAYVDSRTGKEALGALLRLQPNMLEVFRLSGAPVGAPLGPVEVLLPGASGGCEVRRETSGRW